MRVRVIQPVQASSSTSEGESGLMPAQVGLDHNPAELFKRCLRSPAKTFLGLCWISDQQINLCRPVKTRTDSQQCPAARGVHANFFIILTQKIEIYSDRLECHARKVPNR